MFGLRELDLIDTYNPNFDNILESAEITYESANEFFYSNELTIKEIARQMKTGELSSPIKIYTKKRTIISMLAECCEMYLKALFLYEHRNGKLSCKELWSILEAKIKEDKSKEDARVRDKNGNIVYYQTEGDNETPLRYEDGTIKYIYAKVDSLGNLEKTTDGSQIYVDKFGSEYDENHKGRAVKINGHSLNRLIGLLSPESRLILETRLFTIPMDITEKNRNVSIVDILQKNGIMAIESCITKNQFDGWLDQHKRAFEESRYPGQKKTDTNIEFMYHLETQIKAVAQYMMKPKENQKFTITDDAMLRLSSEVGRFMSSHANLMSESLIKLIIENEKIKEKMVKISSYKYDLPSCISSSDFYYMIKLMSNDEINCISYLCWLIDNTNQLDDNYIQNNNQIEVLKAYKLVKTFKLYSINSNQIVRYCIEIKKIFKDIVEIGSNDFYELLSHIIHVMSNYDYLYNKFEILNKNKRTIKEIEKDVDINTLMNNYYKF